MNGPVFVELVGAAKTLLNAGSVSIKSRSSLNRMPDCFVATDRDFKITEINDAAAYWTGNISRDLLGADFFQTFRKTNADDLLFLRAVAQSAEPRHFEMACPIRAGCRVDVDAYPSGRSVAFFFWDSTHQKSAVPHADKAREQLASALDAVSTEIVVLDDFGNILIANRAWHQFIRRSGTFVGHNGIGEAYSAFESLWPVTAQLTDYRVGLKDIVLGKISEFRLEYRARTGAGYRYFRLHAARVDIDGLSRIVVARDDITELQTARHDVDRLASSLINRQKRERARYAAELHDSTVQHLTGASLNLMAVRKKIGNYAEDIEKSFHDIEKSLAEAQREIRSVSYLLYPRDLDRAGLASTLRRFADGYSSRTQIRCFVRTTEDVNLVPIGLQRSVLRIVQEALTNIHRHSLAQNVRIELAVRRRSIRLLIVDDGIGFDSRGLGADASDSSGVGIQGMKARARHFGGRLMLRSSAKGTWVFAQIPVSRRHSRG